MAWAHAMITFPLDLEILKPWLPEGYEAVYTSYPLDVRRQWPGHFHEVPDVRSAKAAGLDGFAVDIFTQGNAADAYMNAADQEGGFHIAACLDGGDEAANIEAVARYCDSARPHSSAAKVGEAFVIFTYDTPHLEPEAWARVRAELSRRGYKTWWMPDLGVDYSATNAAMSARVSSYLPLFEGGYSFGSPGARWDELVELYRKAGKPFGGGMMPGYFRVGGGFLDALATRTLRNEWKQHIRSRLPWSMVVTWNDLSENTEVMPSSDFNLTRPDITAWFSARFRGQRPPWNEPRLYITTPKSVYLNQAAPVEALVLNGSPKYLRARLQMLDSGGKPWGKPTESSVAPASDSDATLSLKLAAFPPGRFLRARATLLDGPKRLSSVISAPICIMDEEAQPGLPTLYHSIPAAQALGGRVSLKLDGTPRAGRSVLASVVAPPGVRAQFSEVLFNNEILKNFLDQPVTPLQVPMRTKNAIKTPDGSIMQPTGVIKGGTPWGFYMARVTDGRYRVAYSDPVYVAPEGDLKLKEQYSFDEGMGSIARDASAFARAGEAQNVDWIRPGRGGNGAALSFNGHDSRLNPSIYGTPNGPLSIKVSVRPRRFGGLIYADAGGTWITTDSAGHVQWVRLGGVDPHRWITAQSANTIPLGQWSDLECTWDGARLRIFISGRADGEAPCPPLFGSWRRAVGYNPFGTGSDYFEGEVDDLTIRSLQKTAEAKAAALPEPCRLRS